MNFFYYFLLKLLLKWSWALTHAEKSQLGMEFRAALTGSSGTSKCLPVEPPAAGIIPQLSFSLATWMAGWGDFLQFRGTLVLGTTWGLTVLWVLGLKTCLCTENMLIKLTKRASWDKNRIFCWVLGGPWGTVKECGGLIAI